MPYKASAFLLGLLLVLGLFAAPSQAQNPSDAIKTMLQQRDARVKQLLANKSLSESARREALKQEINKDLDFQAMAREALGPYWAQLKPDSARAFVAVFADIVRDQSLANLDVFGAKVTYGTVQVRGDQAVANTTAAYTSKGKTVQAKVVYEMTKSGTAWRVTDIVLDDVSTVDGYKRSFQAKARKDGVEALLASLRKRQARAR